MKFLNGKPKHALNVNIIGISYDSKEEILRFYFSFYFSAVVYLDCCGMQSKYSRIAQKTSTCMDIEIQVIQKIL